MIFLPVTVDPVKLICKVQKPKHDQHVALRVVMIRHTVSTDLVDVHVAREGRSDLDSPPWDDVVYRRREASLLEQRCEEQDAQRSLVRGQDDDHVAAGESRCELPAGKTKRRGCGQGQACSFEGFCSGVTDSRERVVEREDGRADAERLVQGVGMLVRS